ncbi:MAG: hypothetical protein ACE366_18070 [Bradymonadia bacterium]
MLTLLALNGCDTGDSPASHVESSSAGACVPGEPAIIAPVGGWRVSTAEEDVFSEHRPAAPDCPDYAITIEGFSLEIDTGACDYVTLVQPLPAISTCDTLGIDLAHLPLEAPEPAMAHFAVAIGDEIIWSREIEIPNGQQVYQVRWSMEEAVPEGTLAAVHLHNHGANSWYIGDLRRTPAR